MCQAQKRSREGEWELLQLWITGRTGGEVELMGKKHTQKKQEEEQPCGGWRVGLLCFFYSLFTGCIDWELSSAGGRHT